MLAASLAVEHWLLARQVRAVRAHRDRVPAAFAAVIAPADHARAADYTVARARLAIAERYAAATLALALTVGGGLAAIDAAAGRLDLPDLARQVATVAAFGRAYVQGMHEAGPYLGLGLQIAGSMALFTGAGYFIDRALGTRPWGIIVGATLAFVGIIALVVRLGNRAGRKG